MSLQTDFAVSPYWDDYNTSKNYYRVLFKPGVAVQARELTQLQTILQNQIERFGDNIFKRGTIIDGCSLIYHDSLPYIKIKDVETDNTPVNISQYDNLYLRNSSNVTAYIVKTVAGFESRSPNLNTLYIKYNSSGSDSNTSTFLADEILTVYEPSNQIFKMRVLDGSSSFSNTDYLEVVSAIAVQNSTGGSLFPAGAFSINNIIQNGVSNATIIEANTTANSEVLILKIKPLASDLKTANNVKWRFSNNESIRNANTANVATIVGVIGYGAKGSITTNALGKITSVSMTNNGSGYYYQPYVTASITSNSAISLSEISQVDIAPQNYLTTVTVANSAVSPVGTGYGITVDEGVIYQKGFFSRVERQLSIVNKYSNTNFTKSVGFFTEESIVDSNIDQSLLDNATGTNNYTAPGADRLKLDPVLYVLEKSDADANTEFLPIVEFSDGKPYKQNNRTVYNIIGDELARRTYEESGNYVLDQFILTTKDSSVFSDNNSVFKINIDPGSAYIKGYRVETTTNYTANVDKGVDTVNSPNSIIKIGYGNYIKIKQLGGIFQFNTGDVVDLYDTVSNYITTNAGATITASGNRIGQARMRSLILEEGEPGTQNAVYDLYLFDIVMDQGKNFSNVKSVFYNGTNKGIADVVLDVNNNANVIDSNNKSLMFKPLNALKYANNITYTYRSINQSKTANSTGFITLTPGVNEAFPYTGNLNSIEKKDFLVIPLGNYQSQTNATGTIAATTASANVIGSGGMNFVNEFKAGDFIKIANSTLSVVKQVSQIVNTSFMIMTSNVGSTITANCVLYFPKNVPISLTSRDTRSANVAANGQLTISLANTIANTTGFSSAANVAVIYNITANNINPAAKTSNRGVFARIKIANNVGGNTGPWALGISDVYRLRGVYVANGASQTKTFNSNTSIASNFISISDNPFANGDSILYTTPASNTVISGLANNTSYYVVYSNTSGLSLSTTRGGSNVSITASSLTENHNLAGSPTYFTENTYGVTDVTNNYYIDNNQKEDYLDISYLYKKPRTGASSSNDILLVKYDSFTTSAGIKTISSYSINDTANLATLFSSSNINTMEIPEVFGTDGGYFDIRDQLDFRPSSSNTIPLITDSSNTLIVNPVEPSNNTRFSSTEQMFPLPNSNLNVNITYYLARNDRVILDKNGNFVVVKGVPGALDVYPSEPKDSITLQYLRIPPYPSLPFSLSKDMVNIIDTKIANEKNGTRKDNFRILTPVDKDQRARIQTKNYRMSDLATLERRIKDLEYYVSFTLAETITKSRFIPSNINSAIDRYKFGFFVDPFTDYTFSDVENPEFWVNISDDLLKPKISELNLEFEFDALQNGDVAVDDNGLITLPYIEYELLSQNDATDNEPIDHNVTITTVTQSTAQIIESQKNKSRSDNPPYVYDEFNYTFSSLVGPAEIYLNSRDNNMAIEILQSVNQSGPWNLTTSSANAQAVTQADWEVKGISGLNDGRRFEHLGSLIRKSYGPVGGFLEDQHKVLWSHDPEAGLYYKIRVYKGKNHGASGSSGSYGYKLFYPTDTVTTSVMYVTDPTNFKYVGSTHSIQPSTFTLTMSYNNIPYEYGYIPYGIYVADAQKFNISITSLKPNTYHNFYIAGDDLTGKCKQIRSSTNNTTGLLSDSNGVLNFDFYYDAGIDESTSDIQQQYKLLASSAGSKIFTIKNVDSSSFSTGEIVLKFYTNLTPEIIGSYSNLNVPNNTNSYDYSSGFGTNVDYNTNSATPTYDENVTIRNWDGASAFVGNSNRKEFGDKNQIL